VSADRVLVDILIVLLAAKLAAEGAERLGIPAVIGEIGAGIVIGPSVLGWVEQVEVLRVLGELGVILLLLDVGLQMDLGELRSVGRASLLVAVVGVAVPFVLGYGVASSFGHAGHTALFVGAALTATSVGITARVFGDLRALASTEARIVLGAAVADDVIGLVILTVVVRIATEGSVSMSAVLGIVALAIGFLVVTGAAGVRMAPPLFAFVHRIARSTGTLVAIALAFTLAFAELAHAARLAPIVGAFVAGLSLGRSAQAERVRRELAPVGHVFIPVFFLQIGIDAQIREFARPEVLGLAAALLAVAIVGKLASPLGAVGSPGDKVLIGIGMLPRGEVGLIFATLGLREHVLGENLYAALLLVILATTFLTPPLLRWRLLRVRGRRRGARSAPVAEPPDGWLRVDRGIVDLAAQPPDHLALHVALRAAAAVVHASPGPELLDWLGGIEAPVLRWDTAATRDLLDLLRDGNARSWRLLETTSMLERALPELAATMRSRRADAFELDPAHGLRWTLVDRVREVATNDPGAAAEHSRLQHPERLLLAALILDAAGDGSSPVEVARRLVKRLDLGAAAEQEVALIVSDGLLLRAAAMRADGLDEEPVLQLASHLERPERARALYVLAVASADLEPVERRRIDELHELVQAALGHAELTGRGARNLVERRRAEAVRFVGAGTPAAERIEAAPRAYLSTQSSEDVARQAELLEPLPARGTARVAVTPADARGEHRVEVASRDQRGLLAIVTGVLRECELEVRGAAVATWGDGGALESFVVGAPDTPNADRLRMVVEASLATPPSCGPVSQAEVVFDDDASPWYTLCEIRAPDRPGLLHAFATSLAAAGADVHAARVTTVDGWAVDHFELTDRDGRKLDDSVRARVRGLLLSGVAPSRRRWWLNRVGTKSKHSGDWVETNAS
jgi:Kef-type K+ transport system membrane component KefB